jgi:steroid 5-alpha reductase family enzyme
VLVVSLPVQAALMSDATDPSVPLGVAGVVVWAVGMLFEAGGDAQLARFKADPENEGKVLDTGFWRYTRHPNYFGDFMVWWGHFLVALSLGAPWWTAVGPLVMSGLLMKVSGVPLLEKSMKQRRPAYADYVARTSAFFPWPPRDGG